MVETDPTATVATTTTTSTTTYEFYSKPGNFCHPNANMTSVTVDDAMEECHDDKYCYAFYKVCEYDRFRKCNDTAYEEDSGCGDHLGPSLLYIKGNKNY